MTTDNDMREEIQGLGTRFDGLEQKFGGLEQKFVGLEQEFDGLERKVDGLPTKAVNPRDHEGLGERFCGSGLSRR